MLGLLILAAAAATGAYVVYGGESYTPSGDDRIFFKDEWTFTWNEATGDLRAQAQDESPVPGGPSATPMWPVGNYATLPEAEEAADAWVLNFGPGLEGVGAPAEPQGPIADPKDDPDPGVGGIGPIAGVTMLPNQCAYDKPADVMNWYDLPVGPTATALEIPIMNAYAGCSTPLRVKICITLSAPVDVAYIGDDVPKWFAVSRIGLQFDLQIVGDAKGYPKTLKMKNASNWPCPGPGPQKNVWGEVKSIKPAIVDDAAGLRIVIDPKGNYTKLISIEVDATS